MDVDGLQVCLSHLPDPGENFAFVATEPGDPRAAVAEAEAILRRNGMPFGIAVLAGRHPSVDAAVRARGHRVLFEEPAMTARVANLAPVTLPPDVRLAEAGVVDLAAVAALDAVAFDGDIEVSAGMYSPALLDVSHEGREDRRGRDRRSDRRAGRGVRRRRGLRCTTTRDRSCLDACGGAGRRRLRDRVALGSSRGRKGVRTARVPRGRTDRGLGRLTSGGSIRADRTVDDRAADDRSIECDDRSLEHGDRGARDHARIGIVALEQRERDRIRTVRNVNVVEHGTRRRRSRSRS